MKMSRDLFANRFELMSINEFARFNSTNSIRLDSGLTSQFHFANEEAMTINILMNKFLK